MSLLRHRSFVLVILAASLAMANCCDEEELPIFLGNPAAFTRQSLMKDLGEPTRRVSGIPAAVKASLELDATFPGEGRLAADLAALPADAELDVLVWERRCRLQTTGRAIVVFDGKGDGVLHWEGRALYSSRQVVAR